MALTSPNPNPTITIQGITYTAKWSDLPTNGQGEWLWKPSSSLKATVVVPSGNHAGTYTNVPVMVQGNNYWVWPNGEFSLVTSSPIASIGAAAHASGVPGGNWGLAALAASLTTAGALIIKKIRGKDKRPKAGGRNERF